VTFLFTDIEGSSTRLWENAPSAMQHALERHDAIVQDAIAGHDVRTATRARAGRRRGDIMALVAGLESRFDRATLTGGLPAP
jgi:hypothetical protein